MNSLHFIQNISEIQTFNSNLHPEFGNLRTLTIDGEPWFVGKDVAEALGYFNTSKAIITHVADEDKIIKMLPNSQNGKTIGKTYIINESGLYSLILSSKLEKAKPFKHWVTAEVLPTIRKTGGYINQGQEDLFIEIHLVPTSHLQYSYIIKIRRRNRHEKESQKISYHSSCCYHDILTSTFSISGNQEECHKNVQKICNQNATRI